MEYLMVHWFWIKLGEVLLGGVLALADYLSLHVLLCLIPAFFIAGAMMVFIPKEAIIKYMGKDSKRIIAYPVAAISGLLLAVCSCTVLPLFAGIKKKGAGLGPAMTFLFSAPAINILAITYTGVLIGMDIAIARAIIALGFSIIIGLLMEFIFREKKDLNKEETIEEKNEEESEEIQIAGRNKINYQQILKTILVLLLLTTGVLIAFLNRSYLLAWGISNPPLIQTIIWGTGSLLFVGCIFLIKNKSLNLFLGLIYLLFTGTSQISYFTSESSNGSTQIKYTIEYLKSEAFRIDLANMGIKAVLSIFVSIIIVIYVVKSLDREEIKEWMRETWSFVKMIFPYLILGVFIAGALGELIPENFIQNLVGENTVVANTIGVLFGVIAYFPTLMEVPIARMFLDLGMSRGVLLAYLLADPELSIQSILVTRKFIGDKKNIVYVLLVIIFTVIAGLLFGLIVSKEPISFI
jgi:uncharacterized membrane protein YraQ (UPF0718 family)